MISQQTAGENEEVVAVVVCVGVSARQDNQAFHKNKNGKSLNKPLVTFPESEGTCQVFLFIYVYIYIYCICQIPAVSKGTL